jgi:hypothetical protein
MTLSNNQMENVSAEAFDGMIDLRYLNDCRWLIRFLTHIPFIENASSIFSPLPSLLYVSAEHGHHQLTVHLATTAALYFHCSSNERVPGLLYVSVPQSVICLRTLLVAMVTRAVSLLPRRGFCNV